VVEAAQGRGSRMVEKEACSWDEERSENPEYARAEGWNCKMQIQMQQLLEGQWYQVSPHFGFAAPNAETVGDSLSAWEVAPVCFWLYVRGSVGTMSRRRASSGGCVVYDPLAVCDPPASCVPMGGASVKIQSPTGSLVTSPRSRTTT
jgi:hypothetical protein